nr:hypothetical protein [Tanacetum cinerariifolium]
LEDLKELAEYKESLENSSKEIATSNSNQEKEEPPQDYDIRYLIREECSIEVCEEQKQNMEDTILELVDICRKKELLCMHDNVDDLIECALNSKLLSINSQRLDKKEQEVKNVVEQPAEHGNYEIIKSGVEELVPILSENEVTLEDKRECDLPVYENSPICDDHSKIFSDSNNDDDISSDDDDFEDVDGNTTTHTNDSLPEYDSFFFEIEPDQERLINVVKNDISNDSTSDPLLEEADLFLTSENSIPPGIENFGNDSEGDIRFLEELLIDDPIPFPNNESSESDFDSPSILRPPPEPPDKEFDFGIDT